MTHSSESQGKLYFGLQIKMKVASHQVINITSYSELQGIRTVNFLKLKVITQLYKIETS